MLNLVVLIGIGFGIFCLYAGWQFVRAGRSKQDLNKEIASRGVQSQAEVTNLRTSTARRGATYHWVTYRYNVKQANGIPQEFTNETAISGHDYRNLTLESRLPIAYLPDTPEISRLGGGMHETYSSAMLWFNGIGIFVLGLALAVGGIGYLFNQSRNYVFLAGVSSGKLIVPVRVNGDSHSSITQVFRLATDGTQRMNLTNSNVNETYPVWSPDGKHIVFRSDRSPRGIYLMDADGQNQKLLAAEAERYYDQPQWSPDGTHILFQSQLHDFQADTYYDEIWIMNADGSNQKNLSASHIHSDRFAVWSPDSRSIAFSASPVAHSPESVIWVMGVDGPDAIPLTKSTEQDSNPAWSPDGKQIAYLQKSASAAGIWTMNPDGSSPHYLAPIKGDATSLAWSPDGKSLAYVLAGNSTLNQYIYLVDASGGAPHLMGTDISNFAWSPDSKMLVAESTQFSTLGQLVLIDVQSGKRSTIVSDLICDQSPDWMKN